MLCYVVLCCVVSCRVVLYYFKKIYFKRKIFCNFFLFNKDVNECQFPDACKGTNVRCINNYGSYYCACNEDDLNCLNGKLQFFFFYPVFCDLGKMIFIYIFLNFKIISSLFYFFTPPWNSYFIRITNRVIDNLFTIRPP